MAAVDGSFPLGLSVNPYLAVALAMCGIIFISLAATAYMAVYFTRRAKADLKVALTPLATLLDGTADIDNAEVTGRYRGKLTFGRMAHAEGGPVRVFQVEMIDAAGGEGWLFVQYPGRGTTELRPENSSVASRIDILAAPDLAQRLSIRSDWYQLEYSPEGGYVRLTSPMATRKDIPSREAFERQLAELDRLSDRNRELQESLQSDRDASHA
jgi:hypothetical protein